VTGRPPRLKRNVELGIPVSALSGLTTEWSRHANDRNARGTIGNVAPNTRAAFPHFQTAVEFDDVLRRRYSAVISPVLFEHPLRWRLLHAERVSDDDLSSFVGRTQTSEPLSLVALSATRLHTVVTAERAALSDCVPGPASAGRQSGERFAASCREHLRLRVGQRRSLRSSPTLRAPSVHAVRCWHRVSIRASD
jgi:hypothetical protein